jgi:hypothetical protein
MTVRIAMWSGPRNVSTALMRSFGSRADTHVSDEPLYAHYLATTGHPHPLADEIVARGETDWRRIVTALTGPVPGGREVWYQKHMAHHLLPGIERGWLGALEHAFLIREPRAMLASLAQKLDQPLSAADTGLPQQVELFGWSAERGSPPPVIDARDVQDHPAEVLGQLCERVGIGFDPAMLSWEPGPRATDGCWAPHWYGNTLRSSGFVAHRPSSAELDPEHEPLALESERLYAELHRHALRP